MIAVIVLMTLTAATTAAAAELSKQRLGTRSNKLCKTFNKKAGKAADQAKSKREAYSKLAQLQAKLVADFEQVTPAQGVAKTYRKLISLAKRQLGYLKQARDNADDPAVLAELDRKSKKQHKQAKRVANKLGAPACG
jgi:hypothetical protein